VVGWLVAFVLIAVALTVGMRLVPVYLESFQVSSALAKLQEEARFSGSTRGELRDALFRQFAIDDVDSVSRENVSFEDVSGGVQVVIQYERRVHMIGNLDAVASFHKQALVRN
jgi:hypothetical protein